MEDEEETTNKLVEEEESHGHVEEEEFINHVEEFSFSVEGFDYDENTGQISYQNQPVDSCGVCYPSTSGTSTGQDVSSH